MVTAGSSFRPSPEQKAQRAIKKANVVLQELADWTSRGDIAVEYVVGTEPGHLEEILRLSSLPDTDTFLFEFGEALHQLRSSFDNFAFERAEASGTLIANPRTIYFPIVDAPAKWNASVKPLGSIPTVELDRWKQLQPFTLPVPEASPLGVLGRVQIGDKHRIPVVPQPLPGTQGNLAIRLGDALAESGVGPADLQIDFTESPELRDGEVLTRYRFGREVVLLPSTTAAVDNLAWFVFDPPFGRVDIFQFTQALSELSPRLCVHALRRHGNRATIDRALNWARWYLSGLQAARGAVDRRCVNGRTLAVGGITSPGAAAGRR